MDLESVAREVVDSAVEVHRTIGGPGLLESFYEEALCLELQMRGLVTERQKLIRGMYKARLLEAPLRVDLLVEECVVVECKAVSEWNRVFQAQLLTYLRIMDLRIGFALNFGERRMKDGIVRVVNKHRTSRFARFPTSRS